MLARRVGGVQGLTPWHPVHLRGAWHFPAIVGAPLDRLTSHVVNLVLSPASGGYQPLLVDGTPCVTLGHGLRDRGAAHPFWGSAESSEGVLATLRAHEGWQRGQVVMAAPLRASTTRLP